MLRWENLKWAVWHQFNNTVVSSLAMVFWASTMDLTEFEHYWQLILLVSEFWLVLPFPLLSILSFFCSLSIFQDAGREQETYTWKLESSTHMAVPLRPFSWGILPISAHEGR